MAKARVRGGGGYEGARSETSIDSTFERIDDTTWEGRHAHGEVAVLCRYSVVHDSMLERDTQYVRADEVVRESCTNWRLSYADGELVHPESGERVDEFVRADHDTDVTSALARVGSLTGR